MKHITIIDIAKALNISKSTVSKAFNNKSDINNATRDLILKKANEMGYSPNPFAKRLINKCSNQIGVVVPEFINAFFHEVILGMQDVLFAKGYQILIMNSNESGKKELENVKTLESNMVDGIISLASKENIAYYKNMIQNGFPMVFFNRTPNEKVNTSIVLFDDYKWAFFATEHLIFQGYKKIFHLSGPAILSISYRRKAGFIDALKKHKLALAECLVIETGLQYEDGEREMEKLIQQNNLPEAIFAVNDPTAIGAMKISKKNGLKIPDDIAIVGFTDIRLAELIDPSLTSVAQPTYDIGRAAAKLLLEQIGLNGIFIPQTVVLNGRLNIRESSVKIQ
jgi:LacI family transcriptional regulator